MEPGGKRVDRDSFLRPDPQSDINCCVLKMNAAIFRTLLVATSLALIVGVHGGELCAAAGMQAEKGCHDCGCAEECSCKGPATGCSCSKKGVSLKTACGCGCAEPMHMGAMSSWKSFPAQDCAVIAPELIWSSTPSAGESQSWHLAHEHEHPPRSSS